MSTADVSGILGEYMLKGWVTISLSYPYPTQLERTPVHFCANCDGGPESIRPSAAQLPDTSASSSSSHFSRSSTPPTEVSSTLSSPVFAPPPETEESRRRRQQSDEASAAIGQRLLKGWAMLADECPNERCFGVPLVRPPNPGGEKSPRKECVICKTVYITEVDWAGRERLVPENSTTDMPTPVPSTSNKDKAREPEIENSKASLEPSLVAPQIPLALALPASDQIATLAPSNTILSILEESAHGLELTLRTLSARLSSLTSGQADPSSIGSVADAISKVVLALGQVRQLQRTEKQTMDGL
ncbi:hypothetical protein MSAN_01437700 [Mycena sanguinolenta]|uniref:Uncharacterized protein n=1 Tax=Mycena sanguinolenta TaxID=230812 RepID=A0A8H6YBB8_9AGAR|nr:hypothetical protein MSAN_01437700 [Mycena sanguinolenta]